MPSQKTKEMLRQEACEAFFGGLLMAGCFTMLPLVVVIERARGVQDASSLLGFVVLMTIIIAGLSAAMTKIVLLAADSFMYDASYPEQLKKLKTFGIRMVLYSNLIGLCIVTVSFLSSLREWFGSANALTEQIVEGYCPGENPGKNAD